jgi:asparagine synthase (glutamine-hydrolysing)
MILGSYSKNQTIIQVIPKKGDKNFETTENDITVVGQGTIYTFKDIKETNVNAPGNLIIDLYLKRGELFADQLNGDFSIALYDKRKQKLILIRDRFGAETVFYTYDQGSLYFSSNLDEIFKQKISLKKEINRFALQEFLLRCYIPGEHTIFNNVKKVKPAHYIVIDQNGMQIKRYWDFPTEITEQTEDQIKKQLYTLMTKAVQRRIDQRHLGILLSGGMDSSVLLALSCNELKKNDIRTFTYRVEGRDVDESPYAEAMAKFCDTKHSVSMFGPQDADLIKETVQYLEEPSCDIGLYIAFFKLAKIARKDVDYLFTGDGGDELFAGHPQYIAEKIIWLYDAIGSVINLKPLAKLGSFIMQIMPDSDEKKDLGMIIRKWLEGMSFPASLCADRWRIYYSQKEINKLLKEPALDNNTILNNRRYSKDRINNALFVDYEFVVQSYFNRDRLSKSIDLDIRTPFMDYELIEYVATLPSHFKMKGYETNKYILKQTMEGKLPYDIMYRKNKMGNSMLMKKWMRNDDHLKLLINTYLSKEVVEKRGIFNYEVIQKLIDDHNARKTNNANRIWALIVLELWLQKHF